MVRTCDLRDALKCILNAERRGKRQALIRPRSKVIVRFLRIMKSKGYIDTFEEIDDHRAGKIVVSLNGRINKCGVICPRFDISLARMQNTVQNLLPARQFGCVVFTTSSGILTHEEAQRRGTGGKILGYFF